MTLSPTMQKFILHWGEMGSRWGVNRTVAQIHALLYLSNTPLNAEQISDTLGVARSNVSTSLKELQSWRLVKISHQLGDRRDYFDAHKDVWEIFFIIMEERKKRELDPTLTTLRECVLDAENDRQTPAETRARIQQTLAFLEESTAWFDQVKRLERSTLLKLLRLGGKIQGLLGRKPS